MAAKLNDFQEKWLQALESGEWKQTRGILCRGGGYCCLGVAAHLYGVDDEILRSDTSLIGRLGHVADALCLYNNEGRRRDCEGTNDHSLICLNDGIGGRNRKTFVEIAAIIRADPGAYFSNCAEESE